MVLREVQDVTASTEADQELHGHAPLKVARQGFRNGVPDSLAMRRDADHAMALKLRRPTHQGLRDSARVGLTLELLPGAIGALDDVLEAGEVRRPSRCLVGLEGRVLVRPAVASHGTVSLPGRSGNGPTGGLSYSPLSSKHILAPYGGGCAKIS